MRRIPLNDARVGMLLAADAVNAQQMLLLKKGAVLTENSLHMLKSWGVEAVWIAQEDTADSRVKCPSVSRDDPVEDMSSRFGDTLEDPIMVEICRSATRIVSQRKRPSE